MFSSSYTDIFYNFELLKVILKAIQTLRFLILNFFNFRTDEGNIVGLLENDMARRELKDCYAYTSDGRGEGKLSQGIVSLLFAFDT
jgi:hypothetical protein